MGHQRLRGSDSGLELRSSPRWEARVPGRTAWPPPRPHCRSPPPIGVRTASPALGHLNGAAATTTTTTTQRSPRPRPRAGNPHRGDQPVAARHHWPGRHQTPTPRRPRGPCENRGWESMAARSRKVGDLIRDGSRSRILPREPPTTGTDPAECVFALVGSCRRRRSYRVSILHTPCRGGGAADNRCVNRCFGIGGAGYTCRARWQRRRRPVRGKDLSWRRRRETS